MGKNARVDHSIIYADFNAGRTAQQLSAATGYTIPSIQRIIRQQRVKQTTDTVIPFPDETARKAIEILSAPTEAEDIEAVLEKHALEDIRLLDSHVKQLQAAGKAWHILVIADHHIPDHEERAFRLHVQIAAKLKPALIVHLGDAFGFDMLSRFPPHDRKGRGDVFQPVHQYWNPITRSLAIAAPQSMQMLMGGNHEAWFERFTDEHPEVGGSLELDYANLVRQNGRVKWLNRLQEYTLPNLILQHGTRTNVHAAKAALEDIGGYMTQGQGHVHRVTKWVKVARTNQHRRIVISVSVPCSCKIPPSYTSRHFKDTPNWVNGCAVFTIMPGGDEVFENEYIYHQRADGQLATVFGAEMLTSEPPDIRYDRSKLKTRAA